MIHSTELKYKILNNIYNIYKKKNKKTLLKQYNKLPEIPYNSIIRIDMLGKLAITNFELIKIYSGNKIYKIKPELWDILSYIIDLIENRPISQELQAYIYIDSKDNWINEMINFIKIKYIF